jgi:pyruvate dehydrogenase complex dehydrogenase (E1) component
MSHLHTVPDTIASIFPEAGVDSDPEETREWLEALEGVVHGAGQERGLYLSSYCHPSITTGASVPGVACRPIAIPG